jgi:RES domain-containing protein
VTVTVYRLVKLKFQDQIFSGLGGLYAHGRWTQRGRPVVYTSGSVSLAVLEYTVNYRRRGWVPALVLGRAKIPDSVAIETVRSADLPANWFAAAAPASLQDIGEDWLERGATAILKVPSAVVPEEWNYVLNPQHADLRQIVVPPPEPFSFDRRLARTRKR